LVIMYAIPFGPRVELWSCRHWKDPLHFQVLHIRGRNLILVDVVVVRAEIPVRTVPVDTH